MNFYGLFEWFSHLSSDQQKKIKTYYSLGLNVDPKALETGDITSSGAAQGFLSAIGFNAIGKDNELLEGNHSLPIC